MIKKIKVGRKAFPHTCFCANSDGMSLRDWFAGMALEGALANCYDDMPPSAMPAVAKLAYDQADAMLAEREKLKP